MNPFWRIRTNPTHHSGGRSVPIVDGIKPGFASQFSRDRILVGILEGEGVGKEVVPAAVAVLKRICELEGVRLELRRGGPIGRESIVRAGKALSDEVQTFCSGVFDDGGAVLCGPGGARFVYELRAHFDLYCKLTPLRPFSSIGTESFFRTGHTDAIDILAIRENTGGMYFCEETDISAGGAARGIRAQFVYTTTMVRRILEAGCSAARQRRSQLSLTIKPDGIPLLSDLWRSEAERMCRSFGIDLEVLEIDNAIYQLIADPKRFDVVVSPNMFGDILADAGSLLLGSRGMSFSGNFGDGGRAVYQTGHGAAYDIAGRGTANPLGQVMAIAMMLRESFGLEDAARSVEQAIANVLKQGTRTADLAGEHSEPVSTHAMATHVADALVRQVAPV